MKRRSRVARTGLFVALAVLSFGYWSLSVSTDGMRVEIVSYVVRDRVIPLDRVEIRSMVIVAFKILPKIENTSSLSVQGELYHNDRLISEDIISHLDSSGDSLGFDIALTHGDFDREAHYSIPEGRYRIVIRVYDGQKRPIAQTIKEVMRNDIARTFEPSERKAGSPLYIRLNGKAGNSTVFQGAAKGTTSRKGDYLLFQRSTLSRVYTDALPGESDQISEISAEVAAAEYRSVAFSLHALRNLGRVRVRISALKGKKGALPADSMRIGAITELTEVIKSENSGKTVFYRLAPKLIEPRDVVIPQNVTQTYWITVKAGSDTAPGDYHGVISIEPQLGRPSEIPFHVRVLPLRLSDTDIQYGMMMDYAFYELDNNEWNGKDRILLKQSGNKLYKDLREHGITIIYPHSHFYYKTGHDGKPVLESLRASLKAYRKLNFPGPFCWYIGHLLQTAKPKHPGSVLSYDAEVAKRRLNDLLLRYEQFAGEVGVPKKKLLVQLVDEPDPEDRERFAAGKELNKIAEKMGFKTLITRAWPDVDYICTGIPDNDAEARELRSMGKQWWIYPNNALNSMNLAYTRYVFGYGAWLWGVNGVVPWTFQMSQGSNGNPFTVLDGSEIMVAYPGVYGLISTPTWEMIREGINDYKYVYLLKQLILKAKMRGILKAQQIEKQLLRLKENLGRPPGAKEEDFGDWSPDTFSKKRKEIITWALDLQGSLGAPQ